MKMSFRKSLCALACASSLFLVACGSSDDDAQYVSYNTYVDQKTYNKDTVPNAESTQVITYKMPGVAGGTVNTTALVMFPKMSMPTGGWRVVVWDHGTVGLGDSCAPSENTLQTNVKGLAEALLAAGYVIVAPDYEGLGSKGIHPYLNLSSAAQSGIYAVKAVKEYYGSKINGAWMTVGQSQGGHAALATGEYAKTDASYKGTVAAAPASSLGYIIGTIAPVALDNLYKAEQVGVYPAGSTARVYAELLAYAAYVAVGIKSYEPNFNYQDIFHPRSYLVAQLAEGSTGENGQCLTPMVQAFMQDIQQYIQENPTKGVTQYPGLVANFENHASVKKFLALNQPATQKIEKPVLVIQGKEDLAIPYQVTQGLVAQLKAMGTDVHLELVEDAGHTEAIVMKRAELLQFIKTHMPAQ